MFSPGTPIRCYAFGNAILDLERLQISGKTAKFVIRLSNTTVAQPSQSSFCRPLKKHVWI